MTPRRLPIVLLCLVSFLALSGCGASKNPPPEGTITAQPSGLTWTATANTGISVQFQPVVITVYDNRHIPLAGVNVILSLDLSAGTSTSPNMGIYLSDPTTGQPTTPVITPTDVTTGPAGTVDLWLGMDVGGGLVYSGDLYAYSGSLMITAPLAVTCTAATSGTAVCQ